jgi:hypothetical protein
MGYKVGMLQIGVEKDCTSSAKSKHEVTTENRVFMIVLLASNPVGGWILSRP